MTRRNDPVKQAALDALAAADLEHRELKATIDHQLRIERERRLDASYTRLSILAFEARRAGASLQQIAEVGLHTKARNTAITVVENGARYIAPEPLPGLEKPVAKEFAWVDGDVRDTEAPLVLRITPSEKEVAPLLPLLGIDPADYRSMEDMQSAEFSLSATEDGGCYLEPVTEAFDPSFGRHPVVALVMSESSDIRKRALKWAEAA